MGEPQDRDLSREQTLNPLKPPRHLRALFREHLLGAGALF